MSKSGIHIKPSHEGRFTKKAKAAGRTVLQEAHAVDKPDSHASAATRKQAQFVLNAHQWHHGG